MLDRTPIAAALLAALAFGACSDPSGPGDGNITIEFTDAGLRAHNRTGNALYYVAVNPRSFLVWAPCHHDTVACAHIDAGAAVTIGLDQVLGWQDDPEADRVVFNYYRLVRAGDGYDAGPIRSITIVR